MSQLNHDDYYVARARTARSLAARASDPSIAAIHREMAARYDAMAAKREPMVTLVSQRL